MSEKFEIKNRVGKVMGTIEEKSKTTTGSWSPETPFEIACDKAADATHEALAWVPGAAAAIGAIVGLLAGFGGGGIGGAILGGLVGAALGGLLGLIVAVSIGEFVRNFWLFAKVAGLIAFLALIVALWRVGK